MEPEKQHPSRGFKKESHRNRAKSQQVFSPSLFPVDVFSRATILRGFEKKRGFPQLCSLSTKLATLFFQEACHIVPLGKHLHLLSADLVANIFRKPKSKLLTVSAVSQRLTGAHGSGTLSGVSILSFTIPSRPRSYFYTAIGRPSVSGFIVGTIFPETVPSICNNSRRNKPHLPHPI